MSKTFEALKRGEEETGAKSGVPPATDKPEENKSLFPSIEDKSQQEIPPPTSSQGGSEIYVEVYSRPEMPSLPVKLKKVKDNSMAVEEYRKMKYKIFNHGDDKTNKTILFCSSDWGEGNSTVSLHFGQTLAAEGYRVLLVDCNLRYPSLHRLFRLEQENGLVDLCFGKSNLKNENNVMKKTGLANLWVITSGSNCVNPVAILESQLFNVLIQQLKMRVDWVLFDSPPLNRYSDSIALASKMDGVVLVVEAEKTRWEVVQKSKERLENSGGRILGVVLNKRRFYIPNWIYKSL